VLLATKIVSPAPIATVWTVARCELWRAVRSRRLFWAAGTAASLLLVAQAESSTRYRTEVSAQARAVEAANAEWRNQEVKSPHATNHFGKWIFKPPHPLSIFEEGVSGVLGREIVLDAHAQTPLVGSESEDRTSVLGGRLDFGFVVGTLLALLALLLTHDAFAGDREGGQLKALSTSAPSRHAALLGKVLGQVTCAACALVAPALLAGGVLPLVFGIPLAGHGADLALLAVLVCVHVLVFTLIGAAISSAARSASGALGAAFGCWLMLCFVIPRASVLVAEEVHPPARLHDLHRQQVELTSRTEGERRARFDAVVKQLHERHPEIPADFAVSAAARGERAPATWAVDPGGVFVTEANAIMNRERERAIATVRERAERRERLAYGLASLSPSVWFARAAAALARTDIAHHRHFERQVRAFFETFGAFFNRLWANNVSRLEDVEAAPSFVYTAEPAGAPRERAGAALGVLLATAAALALGLAARLRRYDVR